MKFIISFASNQENKLRDNYTTNLYNFVSLGAKDRKEAKEKIKKLVGDKYCEIITEQEFKASYEPLLYNYKIKEL